MSPPPSRSICVFLYNGECGSYLMHGGYGACRVLVDVEVGGDYESLRPAWGVGEDGVGVVGEGTLQCVLDPGAHASCPLHRALGVYVGYGVLGVLVVAVAASKGVALAVCVCFWLWVCEGVCCGCGSALGVGVAGYVSACLCRYTCRCVGV